MNIKTNQGFTLLEALLGFLILSIGMLGIASLQAISLKAGQTSIYGSAAMMKVDELFESMRANPTALDSYNGTGPGINNNCAASACDAAMLAQEDVFLWIANLNAGLPDSVTSEVVVVAEAVPSKMSTVTINVTWSERNKDKSGPASVSKTYTTTTSICAEIPC